MQPDLYPEGWPIPSPSVPLFRRADLGRVLLALLVPAGVAVVAGLLGTSGGGRLPPTTAGPSSSTVTAVPEAQLREDFLAVYERSRRMTWLVEYEFRRRLVNGGGLDLEVIELNRPPDHLLAGLGGVSGRIGDQRVVCDNVDDRRVCAPRQPAPAFDEEVAAQVAELRDVLQPPAKWYAVEDGGRRTVAGEEARCFRLRRIVDVPAPPYGDVAEYCFTSDGIQVLSRVERREGVDEREAVEIRRRVSDADIEELLSPG